jgi:hypothetical protein
MFFGSQARRIRTRGAVAAAAAIAVAVVGAGCSSSGSSGSSGSTAASSTSLPNIAALNLGENQPTTLGADFPLKAKPPTGKKICFIANGNPYGGLWYAGMSQAAPALGWTMKQVTANQTQPSTYATAIYSSIQAGCNVAIEAGANLPYWQSAIPAARKAGMLIVDAQTSDTAADNIPGVIRADKSEVLQYYGGVVTGMGFVRDIREHFPKGNAKIMLLMVPQFQAIIQPSHDGMAAAIKAGCPSCTIWTDSVDVSVILGPNANSAFVQALRTHPGTDYMAVSGEEWGGLLPAIRAAGISPVPFIGGGSPLTAAISDLKSSKTEAIGWTGQPYGVQGALMLDAIARYYTNTTPTDPWDGTGSSLPLMPQVTPMDVWLTHANINQYLAEGQNFPANWLTQLEKTWLVG